MKENDWISIEDSLPGLNRKVEIKMKDGNKYNSKIQTDNTYLGIIFSRLDRDGTCYAQNITHWRPIIEKRPDFSRLNERDLISVQSHSFHEYTGYLVHVYDEFIRLNQEFHLIGFEVDIKIKNIKKITRINLEEKTFEEIWDAKDWQ